MYDCLDNIFTNGEWHDAAGIGELEHSSLPEERIMEDAYWDPTRGVQEKEEECGSALVGVPSGDPQEESAQNQQNTDSPDCGGQVSEIQTNCAEEVCATQPNCSEHMCVTTANCDEGLSLAEPDCVEEEELCMTAPNCGVGVCGTEANCDEEVGIHTDPHCVVEACMAKSEHPQSCDEVCATESNCDEEACAEESGHRFAAERKSILGKRKQMSPISPLPEVMDTDKPRCNSPSEHGALDAHLAYCDAGAGHDAFDETHLESDVGYHTLEVESEGVCSGQLSPIATPDAQADDVVDTHASEESRRIQYLPRIPGAPALIDNNGQKLFVPQSGSAVLDLDDVQGIQSALSTFLRCQDAAVCVHFLQSRYHDDGSRTLDLACDCGLHPQRRACDRSQPSPRAVGSGQAIHAGRMSPRKPLNHPSALPPSDTICLSIASHVAARGSFPSRKDLWYYLKFHGVAEEHHHEFRGLSRRYGNMMQAVALLTPANAYRSHDCVVFTMGGNTPEAVEEFNEQLHNTFESKSPLLHFGELQHRQGEVVYDGVYEITNGWQYPAAAHQREWWWRMHRLPGPALQPKVIRLRNSEDEGSALLPLHWANKPDQSAQRFVGSIIVQPHHLVSNLRNSVLQTLIASATPDIETSADFDLFINGAVRIPNSADKSVAQRLASTVCLELLADGGAFLSFG